MNAARIVNGHRTAAGWSLGTIVAVLTILSLLGLLPWATRAEVKEVKGDIADRLDKIDAKLDRLVRFLPPGLDLRGGPVPDVLRREPDQARAPRGSEP